MSVAPIRVVAAEQSAASPESETIPTLRVSTYLVIVPVTVFQSQGQGVSGLKVSDFRVTEDGAPQTVSKFEMEGPGIYRLGYYTANSNANGNFRNIVVTIPENSGLKLNYRPGYNFPKFAAEGRAAGAANGSGPVVIHKVAPEYSDEAMKATYQGTVMLEVAVDQAGRVVSMAVRRSLGLGLDQKARDAVTQWRFRPQVKDGRPVVSRALIAVRFQLL
jgi:TonB family protein